LRARPSSFSREIHECPDVVFLPVPALEGLLGQGAVQCHTDLERNELRELVDVSVGMTEHPAHITDDGLCRHGAEGNDLRNALTLGAVGGVSLHDVLDDLVPPVHAEVDIEVGQRNALRIQEALEEELVFYRVQIRYAQGVGDQ
jgi:hypothetical protein